MENAVEGEQMATMGPDRTLKEKKRTNSRLAVGRLPPTSGCPSVSLKDGGDGSSS